MRTLALLAITSILSRGAALAAGIRSMAVSAPPLTAVPRVSRRVAVIGGGSAGVVTARLLARAGHRPEVFEAGESFGGVWAARPTNAVVYAKLTTNLPTIVMQARVVARCFRHACLAGGDAMP